MQQVTKTIWTRSTPVDARKQINGEIDTSNIVKGTRTRKDFNYDDAKFTNRVTKPVQMKKTRKSHNILEQRLKKAVAYAKKL